MRPLAVILLGICAALSVCMLVQAPDAYRAASPITYAQRPLPPTLLIQGARDTIVKPRFPRELQRKLLASGNRAVLLEIPWAEHAAALSAAIGNTR